jgi:hypothetical protein
MPETRYQSTNYLTTNYLITNYAPSPQLIKYRTSFGTVCTRIGDVILPRRTMIIFLDGITIMYWPRIPRA